MGCGMGLVYMPALILLGCGVCLISSEIRQSLGRPDCELRLLQVLYRHGDRNPIDPYPTDPYKNESYWPEGYGQLTKIGKMQHYELGQFIRERYKGFLSPGYSPYEIVVRSSSEDRTLMSAEANLAGLYPPDDARSQWSDHIHWQPVPVHSEPGAIDNTLKLRAPCPRYDVIYADFMKSDIMRKVNEENADIYKILSNYTGRNVTNPRDLEYIVDALHIETLYNLPLPDWTNKLFPAYNESLRFLVAFSFQMITYTQEMRKFKAGPLLGEMVEKMRNKSTDAMDKRLKFFVYSGHDTTVAGFLNTLDMFNLQPPPYASMIMIELHLNTTSNKYFVEILYHNDTSTEPYVLRPRDCAVPCMLDDFVALTKPVIPKDWRKECEAPKTTFDLVGVAVGVLVVGLTLGLFICMFLLVMSYLRNKRKGPSPPKYPYLHLQMDDGDNEDA